MKKRIIGIFAILAVFGLAIAAYAYTQTSAADTAKSCCCAKSDSCPMKGKMDHEKSGEHAKADGHKCCGDSCPMKATGSEHAKTEGHSCCGDSCPMKKEGETKATAVSASEEGKTCCENCDCCKGKDKAKTAAT